MTTVLTTFKLYTAAGAFLTEVTNCRAYHYILNCSPGVVGIMELELPTGINPTFYAKDMRIGAYRTIDNRPPYLDNNAIYLTETIRFRNTYTLVRAYHATTLLDRRLVGYVEGSTFADKTTAVAADNLIKTFWKENAGSSIDASRITPTTQTDLSAYVTVQGNLSLGASIAKLAAWRNLLNIAREIAEASAAAGTYVTFEIMAPSEGTLELRTYTGQRGVDRRAGSANPVILRDQSGVFENAQLEIDYHNERTYILAIGRGSFNNILTATSSDTGLIAQSPFGRSEDLMSRKNVYNVTALQDDSDSGLWAARPLITFTGEITEAENLTRGIHFDVGDIVTAESPQTKQQYNVRFDVIEEQDGHAAKALFRSIP